MQQHTHIFLIEMRTLEEILLYFVCFYERYAAFQFYYFLFYFCFTFLFLFIFKIQFQIQLKLTHNYTKGVLCQ